LAALLSLTPLALAQKGYRPPPNYLQFGKPDQEEGRQVLEQFRRQEIAGEYYLEFELRVLPRRGAGHALFGRFWGSRNIDGPVSRVSVRTTADDSTPEIRLLVQGGASPALWRWQESSSGPPEKLGVGALFEPVAGTDLTPFDLQMPFLYWPEFIYEGLARMRGRPAYQFLLYPPAEVAEKNPSLKGVRVYLDTQYTALVQAELIGMDGRAFKTVGLLDLKKVGDQWIVKSVDLRDETTRNKTRFTVTAAALKRTFTPDIFDPANLAEPVFPPADSELVRLTP
jgi:hypothetical protein